MAKVLHNTNRFFLTVLLATTGLITISFSLAPDEEQWLNWSNRCLSYTYDASAEMKLKKWELLLTPDAFIRLRKTFTNGKQEYFSFQLRRFKDLDYLGNIKEGTLQLQANNDDIIVQTYDDPKGNIDSMATTLNIPVKNMDPDKLDSLRSALLYFKNKPN